MAISPNGRKYIAYSGIIESHHWYIALCYSCNDNWITLILDDSFISHTDPDSIYIDQDGNFHILVHAYSDYRQVVYYWGTPENWSLKFFPEILYYGGRGELTGDPDGNICIAFGKDPGYPSYGVFYMQVNDGNWSEPTKISDYHYPNFVRVTLDAYDNPFVSWMRDYEFGLYEIDYAYSKP